MFVSKISKVCAVVLGLALTAQSASAISLSQVTKDSSIFSAGASGSLSTPGNGTGFSLLLDATNPPWLVSASDASASIVNNLTIDFIDGTFLDAVDTSTSISALYSVNTPPTTIMGIDYIVIDITGFTNPGTGDALDTLINFAQAEVTVTGATFAPIPLPASLPLLLAGFGGLVLVRRRKHAA